MLYLATQFLCSATDAVLRSNTRRRGRDGTADKRTRWDNGAGGARWLYPRKQQKQILRKYNFFTREIKCETTRTRTVCAETRVLVLLAKTKHQHTVQGGELTVKHLSLTKTCLAKTQTQYWQCRGHIGLLAEVKFGLG